MVTPSMVAVLLSLELVGQAPTAAPNVSGEWFVVESKEGMFSFAMPARPKEERRDSPTSAGTMKLTVYTCENADTVLTMQYIITQDEAPLNEFADGVESGMKKQIGGAAQVVSRKSITIHGVPGREVVITWDAPDGRGKATTRALVLVRGANVYILVATSRAGNSLSPEATTFLDSVRFDGKPAVRPAIARATPPVATAPVATPANPAAPATTAARPPRRKLIGRINRADTTSEAAFRTFLMAMEAGDEETLRAVTLLHPDFDWLLRGEPARVRGIDDLKQQMIKMRVQRLKAGDKVELAGNEVHVIRASEVGPDHAALKMEGMPAYAALERVKGHWKVDPAPFIAVRKAAWAAKNAPGR
jgi:hypothetical protein